MYTGENTLSEVLFVGRGEGRRRKEYLITIVVHFDIIIIIGI